MKYGCMNATNIVFFGCLAQMCVSLFASGYNQCSHISTYQPNACLINPERIYLSPSQHIRHTKKILVNCWHNLTDMCMVTIQPVQMKLVLAGSACHTYLWSLSLYFYSCMPVDKVNISLLLISTYTGKPTMFMNVFPKCLYLEKITVSPFSYILL